MKDTKVSVDYTSKSNRKFPSLLLLKMDNGVGDNKN